MAKSREAPKPWREISAGLQLDDYSFGPKPDNWRDPVIIFKWGCDWATCWLGQQSFFEILEYVGKLGILLGIILWFVPGCHDRQEAKEDARKTKHYVAWQTINSAAGIPGNAGRADALADLAQDQVSLAGVSLKGGAIISGESNSPLVLAYANLNHADFSDGNYNWVDFSNCKMGGTVWNRVGCGNCNFEWARFNLANFDNAKFSSCDMRGTVFSQPGTNYHFLNCTFEDCDFGLPQGYKIIKKGPSFGFPYARFDGPTKKEGNFFYLCNFVGTSFKNSDWSSVLFSWCNLAYADLDIHSINYDKAFLVECNLFGASNASPGFLRWAYRQPVVFIDITLHPKWREWADSNIVYMTTYQRKHVVGTPEFVCWASNQFTEYMKTNDPHAWLAWSHANFTNN